MAVCDDDAPACPECSRMCAYDPGQADGCCGGLDMPATWYCPDCGLDVEPITLKDQRE